MLQSIMSITPALLIILDGFGYREACEDNAICQARKPHWNFLWETCAHTIIDASEKWVGLPKDQMGKIRRREVQAALLERLAAEEKH